MRIRVGCAGWSIASREAHRFDAGASHLARYATRFALAEINSSFYRPHRRATYERWSASVPGDFRFTVKMPKAVTHDARLRGTAQLVSRFADEIAGLGDALGGVLVQLPPSLAFDARVAQAFFAMIRRRIVVPIVVEARHASWFTPRVEPLWSRHALGRVGADPPRPPASLHPGGAGSVRYWRLHGSPDVYWSGYDDVVLQAYVEDVLAARDAGFECHVVFDNTARSQAVPDALRFMRKLDARLSGHVPRSP